MLQVPTHFIKAPGEDKAIMRRRLAKANKTKADLNHQYRTYSPKLNWSPSPLTHTTKHPNHPSHPSHPNHPRQDVEKGAREGKERRQAVQARLEACKPNMYHGRSTTIKTNSERQREQQAIGHRTRKSVPASERVS
jgi:hypothetical protein